MLKLRQENIDLQSPNREFKSLYKPLGNRYLRGLDSYLYNRSAKPISAAERLMSKGISPFGVQPDNIILDIPKNATREQRIEYLYRQNALNNERFDTGAKFQKYNSGLSTGGVNRDMVEELNIGLIYSTTKRDEKRNQNILP
tara:strand:- start:1135 stop:1560 length:426 start_codon:yes stop_codon:yes gene_type:complete